MELYHIKHQHQETANRSEHSFANCYWLHTRYKHSIPTRQNQSPSNGHPSQTSCHFKLKQLTQTKTHSLHDLNAYSDPPRNTKTTIFHNNDHNNIIILKPNITFEECRGYLKHTHTTTTTTSQYFSSRKNSKVTNTTPNDLHSSEQTLPPSYAYKTGITQSQQIITLAKLLTYSEP